MKEIKVLDCTLRDGGYYNEWDYSPELVRNYLSAAEGSGIDILELGLRFPPKEEFLGPFAYTTDTFLRTLKLPKDIELAVMINTKDYMHPSISLPDHIKKYFAPKKDSPLTWVRVAIHFEEIATTKIIMQTLKDLGYKVGLNLMQAGTKSDTEIQNAGKEIATWDLVDVLYFADSLGNMTPKDVLRVVNLLRKEWHGPMGIHTHNNMGLALSNTIAAIEGSVTWVDATILGMGRGAGNAKTEHLLIELARTNPTKYHPENLFHLVLEDFRTLQRQYEWGENLPYYLAAASKIHPTYVQEVLSNTNYKTHDIISALTTLKNEDAKSFSFKQLDRAVGPKTSDSNGEWSPKSLKGMKSVLIIANGPKLANYKAAVQEFARNTDSYVLSLNINEYIPSSTVDAYVVCNQMRFLLESNRYKDLKTPVIMPVKAAPDVVKKGLSDIEVYDYGMETKDGVYEAQEHKCILNRALALPYALSVCEAAGAEVVYLAGFDGMNNKLLDHEIQEIFDHYSTKMQLKAVTPTTYSIKKSSIFAPLEH